ncbi:hypothetical protein EDD70_2958 [Hydrogenoanaerobacterium saccharovorans]|uniref:Uncharacterized protein n=1 Tax=Hydrogenoanaerobacterium saccharovorans TaxID=474960 RepID=A0A1H7YHM5_9FIRM|nr:hypothetical protein EDD70_2958 [Hydrogenoanaerobacterium saccharovorans]SEM45421.1 hypothetical protein SAMN05216180_0041 [Hydrogenoanaerobacterium saccharovorans]
MYLKKIDCKEFIYECDGHEEHVCWHDNPPNSCEECICKGGDINPKTGKRFKPSTVKAYQSKFMETEIIK